MMLSKLGESLHPFDRPPPIFASTKHCAAFPGHFLGVASSVLIGLKLYVTCN